MHNPISWVHTEYKYGKYRIVDQYGHILFSNTDYDKIDAYYKENVWIIYR